MIPLNQTGTSLLRRFGKLPVQLVITLNTPSGAATITSQHLTIKPPRDHRR
jgi:hypothetical protein